MKRSMNGKLCATVTGSSTEELRTRRDKAVEADMVELRLDYARNVDVAGVLADRQRPVVVTCRPTWEGGRFDGSEEERQRLLAQALELGADYVDIEWRGGGETLINTYGGRRIVLSTHDFDQVPLDLEARYRAMRATGAEVVKVAVQVECLADLVRLRDIDAGVGVGDGPRRVLIGMGPVGVPSRVVPDKFGSCWTYAGNAVAPGQVDLGRMVTEFRFHDVGPTAELYGVIGSPLSHSLSPAMHNVGFGELGRDAVYLPLEASDVDDFTTFAHAFGVVGVSVTAPYKESVISLVDSGDDLSRQVGAVNTLRADGAKWECQNTDVAGFLQPLLEDGDIELTDCRAVVVGAGGAARGVAVGLAQEGAKVTICARRREAAGRVAALVDGAVGEWPPQSGTWELLVNTTPIGTYPNVAASPLPDAALDGAIVYDLVYNPRVTQLMADASAQGCRTIGGLGMLVAQAERQFEWWTGTRPTPGLFRAVAERQLEQVSER